MSDEIDPDHAACPIVGLDIELLAERLGELIGGHAGQDVGGAARRKRIDDADRMARPVASENRRRCQQRRRNNRRQTQRKAPAHSAATRCAATPLAFTTTLIASSTRSLA